MSGQLRRPLLSSTNESSSGEVPVWPASVSAAAYPASTAAAIPSASPPLKAPPPTPWKRPFHPLTGCQTSTPNLSFTPGVVTVAWTRHVATTGVEGKPGNGGGTSPAGVSMPLLTVVFGSDRDVRPEQEPAAASVFEASGVAAAVRANVCVDGAMNALATDSAVMSGISFCSMANLTSTQHAWPNFGSGRRGS